MASPSDTFMQAIRTGDVAAVRGHLAVAPGDLGKLLSWNEGKNDGFPLHYAAWCNQPEVVKCLVTDYRADLYESKGVGSNFTPLDHAKANNAPAAAAALLTLGADPARSAGTDDVAAWCRSEEVLKRLDPDYEEKKKRLEQAEIDKKTAGTWTLAGPRLVVHEYELPGGVYRLTDEFNFETRRWRALAKDIVSGGLTQNIVFFDAIPDAETLRPAFDRLKALGGTATEEDMRSETILKKAPGLHRPS